MEGSNWVVQVNEQLRSMEDGSTQMAKWEKRSIYKLPAYVTDLNKKAYRPQAVSFGPYHHGEEHLLPMEKHKQRALLHFLKRSNKPLELFVESLSQDLQSLMDAYDPLDISWQQNPSKFLQLMILDGCFMLEILRVATNTLDDYATNDPVFSNHGKLYIIPYIRRDMLMLQNQLPMLLLEKLIAVESGQPKDEENINKLIFQFCFPNTPVSIMGKCLHVLDVYRKALLQEQSSSRKKHHRRSRRGHHKSGNHIIRSARELNEAGIRFRKSKTGSLRDISFHGGVLKLPVIVVDDATEFIFLNMIAFERFHVGAGNGVTSFVFFMDLIIDNERDVALLHSRGIIQNAIGSDKAVAKLFNSLSKDITLDPDSSLDVVQKKVNAYCRKAWNEWRANLIHTYFRSPWAMLSLIAAVFLFALTIAQTVYTIYPFYSNQLSQPTPVASIAPFPPPPPPPHFHLRAPQPPSSLHH